MKTYCKTCTYFYMRKPPNFKKGYPYCKKKHIYIGIDDKINPECFQLNYEKVWKK